MPRDHLGFIPDYQFPTPLDAKRGRIKRALGWTLLFTLLAAIGVMMGLAV